MPLEDSHVPTDPVRVAILGTGNIGVDLCERLLRDPDFEVVALVGRRADSPGLKRFENRIPMLLSGGIGEFRPLCHKVEGVFDATNAFDHLEHWTVARDHGLWMIDLTPSRVGDAMVPALVSRVSDMAMIDRGRPVNFSMVTCGGQSAAGIAFVISQGAESIAEVEVSSSIAALSAGPATRANIDQYIESTESVITQVTGCPAAKAILVLNPADPPVMMRTTVTVKADHFNLASITKGCEEIASAIRRWVPGYVIAVPAHEISPGVLSVTVKVTGSGYFLPPYAGNLDIINAAAVETARVHAEATRSKSVGT